MNKYLSDLKFESMLESGSRVTWSGVLVEDGLCKESGAIGTITKLTYSYLLIGATVHGSNSAINLLQTSHDENGEKLNIHD